jgi:hypothetical protein
MTGSRDFPCPVKTQNFEAINTFLQINSPPGPTRRISRVKGGGFRRVLMRDLP